MTDPASHRDAFVAVVVGLTEAPSMADDRVLLAERTPPRQEVQGDHPGSVLSFASGSAIKENHGWREGPPLTVPCESFDLLAGPSPSGKVSFDQKKNTALPCAVASPAQAIGRFMSTLLSLHYCPLPSAAISTRLRGGCPRMKSRSSS